MTEATPAAKPATTPAAKPARRAAKATPPAKLVKTAQPAAAAAAASAAASAYERLVLYIRNFESQLDQGQEIAMGFAGSDAGVLQIEGLGYHEPDIITFYGRDEDGLKTQLVQHVSQLSVMLRAVPKLQPAEPPRRIGFRLTSGWLGGEAGDASAWGDEGG